MLDKPAYNEEDRLFEMAPQLVDGDTIATATLTITDTTDGTDVSASMISGGVSVDGTGIAYRLIGGTAGKTYRRLFRAVLADGQKREVEADLLAVK